MISYAFLSFLFFVMAACVVVIAIMLAYQMEKSIRLEKENDALRRDLNKFMRTTIGREDIWGI